MAKLIPRTFLGLKCGHAVDLYECDQHIRFHLRHRSRPAKTSIDNSPIAKHNRATRRAWIREREKLMRANIGEAVQCPTCRHKRRRSLTIVTERYLADDYYKRLVDLQWSEMYRMDLRLAAESYDQAVAWPAIVKIRALRQERRS